VETKAQDTMSRRDHAQSDRRGIDVTFWGTRGSIPVPGQDTVRFGGNTTCMEVRIGETAIIVDAGSGLLALGNSRIWQPGQHVHLLLTHLHHDHIIGLPFFKAAYVKDLELHIWCGNLDGSSAQAALDRMFSPPLFPLRLSEMPARPVFHGFRAGDTLNVAGETIRTVLLNHPSGATGYRFETPDASLAVITDVEHGAPDMDSDLVAFCRRVDTLVYDTMLDEGEYGRCKGWGHSTSSEAARLIGQAGGRRLVGFHHGPAHTDAVMLRREAALQSVWPEALMAREGQTLTCLSPHRSVRSADKVPA
jgi:phosphoribosyl 1,2-cyclic phosphodiesterase